MFSLVVMATTVNQNEIAKFVFLWLQISNHTSCKVIVLRLKQKPKKMVFLRVVVACRLNMPATRNSAIYEWGTKAAVSVFAISAQFWCNFSVFTHGVPVCLPSGYFG